MQHPDDSGYAIRGRFLTFLPHPDDKGDESNLYYETDGVIVIKEGRFQEVGPASTILPKLPTDFLILKNDNALIVPGFIDLHIHLPQTRVIASYGAQLLEWLENYAFLEERKFSDERYANQEASFFLDELLRNGTTSALVFGSVHPQSINALFDQASKRSMGLIAGKVMMDRNAPSYLRDTSQQSYDESKELIKKWHKRGRHRYAITPRFAITSTEAQLEVAGTLLREDSSLFLQTHLSENLDEIQIVQKLILDLSLNELTHRLYRHCIHLLMYR